MDGRAIGCDYDGVLKLRIKIPLEFSFVPAVVLLQLACLDRDLPATNDCEVLLAFTAVE